MPTFSKLPSVKAMIQSEFDQMKQRNSRFSLRAFARYLQLSPSYLSEVLNDEKRVGPEFAIRFADRLKFQGDYRVLFLLTVEFESAMGNARPLLARKARSLFTRLQSKRMLPDGHLKNLTWHHHLLLVSFDLKSKLGNADLAALTRFAGLKRTELDRLLQELVTAGLVYVHEESYERTHREVIFESNQTNELLKRVHAEYLDRAKKLVNERTPKQRYSATEFYSIPSDRMDLVKERAEEFLDEISSMADTDNPDGVAELALHFNFFSRGEIFSRS